MEHTLGHANCPACQRDTHLLREERDRLRALNAKLLAALEASEAYAARIHSSSPPWDDCPNGVCFWCSDCVHRVINMRRDAIQGAKQ